MERWQWLVRVGEWAVLLPVWRRFIKDQRWRIGAASGVGLVWVLLIVGIASGGGGDDNKDKAASGTNTPKASASASPTAKATATVTATPGPTAEPTTSPTEAQTEAPTAAPTAPPTEQPTQAPPVVSCSATASVDIPNPTKNTVVTVTGVLSCSGASPQGAAMHASWHYKSTTSTCDGTADAGGGAACSRDIGGATSGYTVRIDVTFSLAGQTYNASTSFTPQ